ncbi:MAG TPA: nucleotidyltransferase domain-containing protein [Candidatus Methanoperedens sp.]|nr:nucleotidyltransferase domain-containing protein [Candidatus Methanoperedens sp.]HLB69734.1 nucleotidyltransferase domain-containing protein [Candidatus Methanoperedens sp.]
MPGTRLRDFIITDEDWIFAVADYCHDNGIRSVLRYVPDPHGSRGVDKKYRKLDFDDAFRFMRSMRPEWVKDVHVVPWDRVKEILAPDERLPLVMKDREKIRIIVRALQKKVQLEKMGVTGSHLVGLQNDSSDIDFIVYGSSWFTARDIIANAKKGKGQITEISDEMWHEIYNKRRPELSFEEFLLHEQRKGNRGMVDGTYFDLLYVRDWKEIAPCMRGMDAGYMTVEALVTNADFSFDSPAIYKVEHPEIRYVLSYTHTYAGQGLVGEIIEARGMVEVVGNMKRLVVGTSREPKGEWIRSLTLLEKSS